MTGLSGMAATIVAALVALVLYGIAWVSVSRLPRGARILARAMTALVLVVPVVLYVGLMTGTQPNLQMAPKTDAAKTSKPDSVTDARSGIGGSGPAQAPSDRSAEAAGEQRYRSFKRAARPDAARQEAAPQAGAQPPPAAPDAGSDESEVLMRKGAPPSAMDAPSSAPAGDSALPPPPPTPPPVAAAPPPAPEPEPMPTPAPTPMPAPAAPPAPVPPPTPAPPDAAAPPGADKPMEMKDAKAKADEQTDWDIVPVFFGTDRARVGDAKRLDYGSDRGRRLELGRALVTIPKTHEVPQIERPWSIRIPYTQITLYQEKEDPKRHFTMQKIEAMPKEILLAEVRQRLAASNRFKDHALVFVHGYNTAFENAIFRTAQISYDLKFDGAAFSYSWPSGGNIASYTYDRESAGQCEPYLRKFLEMVTRESGAKSVSIIAHSMGNQALLQVLRDLRGAAPEGLLISQLILAAPDVDRDNFDNIAERIKGIAQGVTLYASANDRALLASRRFHGGVPRAGDVPDLGPIVVPGVDTIDVTAASMDSLGLNHSSYAEKNALLNDIALLVLTGERPPHQRFPILEKVATPKGDYWRYPGGK